MQNLYHNWPLALWHSTREPIHIHLNNLPISLKQTSLQYLLNRGKFRAFRHCYTPSGSLFSCLRPQITDFTCAIAHFTIGPQASDALFTIS